MTFYIHKSLCFIKHNGDIVSRRTEIGVVVVIALLMIGASYYWFFIHESRTKLTVMHAGSLTLPFDYLENRFEENNPDIDVQMESGVSAKLVRSIIDLDKKCDVLTVADYSLIKNELIPDYASWYINFVRDRMVLAYTSNSRYNGEINETNWYEILGRSNVVFGFSNPNDDPCGYRALMVIQLAEIYYNNSEIFDNLIVKNTGITASESNNTFTITCPENIAPNQKVSIRTKSVELIALLQSNSLDYAFEYRSIAVQHNLKFLILPEAIDLSSTSYEDTYSKVKIDSFQGQTFFGKPIVYGLTIPKNAEHEKIAISFVRLLLEEYRNGNMDKFGQPAIVPAFVNNKTALPEELKEYVTE